MYFHYDKTHEATTISYYHLIHYLELNQHFTARHNTNHLDHKTVMFNWTVDATNTCSESWPSGQRFGL